MSSFDSSWVNSGTGGSGMIVETITPVLESGYNAQAAQAMGLQDTWTSIFLSNSPVSETKVDLASNGQITFNEAGTYTINFVYNPWNQSTTDPCIGVLRALKNGTTQLRQWTNVLFAGNNFSTPLYQGFREQVNATDTIIFQMAAPSGFTYSSLDFKLVSWALSNSSPFITDNSYTAYIQITQNTYTSS